MNNSSTVASYVGIVRAQFNPVSAYLTPFLVVLGLVTNTLTVIVLSRANNITTSATSRIYYIWLAVFDIVLILSKELGFSFMNQGLRYIYNDQPPWFIISEPAGNLNCKIIGFFYAMSECVTNGTIAALAFERMLVLYFPFQKHVLTGKWKAQAGLSALLCLSIGISQAFLFSIRPVVNPSFSSLPICSAIDSQYPWAVALSIATSVIADLLFIVIASLCTLASAFKIRSIIAASGKLGRQTDADRNAKDVRSTIVMIITVAINDVIFLPVGFTFCALTAVIVLDPTNYVLLASLSMFWMQFFPLTVLPHAFQFFVYYFKVPGFKPAVHTLFRKS